MNEYVLSIMGTVLIASVLSAILPEGKTSVVIKSIAKLFCVFAVLSPVLRFFDEKNSSSQTGIFSESVIKEDESYIDYCSKKSVENAEKALEEYLSTEYGRAATVTIEWLYAEVSSEVGLLFPISYVGERIRVTKIVVDTDEETNEEEKTAIERVLEEKFGCEVEIA